MKTLPCFVALGCLALSAAACGDAPGGGGGGGGGGGPYPTLFPLTLNASWTYDVTTGSVPVGQKTQTVINTTTLPGVTGDVFVLETIKASTNRTVSDQQQVGEDIVRYSEDTFTGTTSTGREEYTPHKLRISNTMAIVGSSRTDTYTEKAYDGTGALLTTLTKTETWVVEAIESITVPAGTFDSAVRVHRTSQTTASDKLYWFVDGVGKVKEIGAGQTEELSSYTIP